MMAASCAAPPARGVVADLLQHRLERALRERVRYRYVHPRVLGEPDGGYRIESPCCSRNVDPTGGVIDIALLQPCPAAGGGGPTGHWMMFSRDHAAGRWQSHGEPGTLDQLLDILCVDAERVFWP